MALNYSARLGAVVGLLSWPSVTHTPRTLHTASGNPHFLAGFQLSPARWVARTEVSSLTTHPEKRGNVSVRSSDFQRHGENTLPFFPQFVGNLESGRNGGEVTRRRNCVQHPREAVCLAPSRSALSGCPAMIPAGIILFLLPRPDLKLLTSPLLFCSPSSLRELTLASLPVSFVFFKLVLRLRCEAPPLFARRTVLRRCPTTALRVLPSFRPRGGFASKPDDGTTTLEAHRPRRAHRDGF